jgi:hypothetical protein
MEDILPNLIPVAISLLLWLVCQGSRALARGSLFALIVTSVMAVPALALAASVGFKSLDMLFMLTLLLAMASAGAGVVAFIVGAITAGRSTKQEASR